MSIFDFTDPKEERNERIAQMAANLCNNEHYNPTDALDKVAKDNALTNPEIEDVCAKLNHILFREKFPNDKLATFNAAKYSDITGRDVAEKTAGDQSGVMDIGNYDYSKGIGPKRLQKRAEELSQMPSDGTVDPITEVAGDKYRNYNITRFIEQATANAGEISAHHMAIDNIVSEMKSRILDLYRQGVSLEEIYNTILMSLGESQAPAITQYFTGVIEDLKQEGYMPKDQKLYLDDPEKTASYLPADYSADKKISEMAIAIRDNINQAIFKEAAHEMAMDALCALDKVAVADSIDKYVEEMKYIRQINQFVKSDFVKVAAVISEPIRNALLGGLATAAGTALVGGSIMAGSDAYRSIKKNSMKKKLLTLYPDLKNIPEAQYNDLYDTITGLDPHLIKAPYAIAEMIKRFATYGTIDTGNILQLQSAHKPGPSFSDYALTSADNASKQMMKRLIGATDSSSGGNTGGTTSGNNPNGLNARTHP